jgi:hypothetical protein
MRLQEIPLIKSRQDQDGTMIAPGRRNPYRQDHLFEDLPHPSHFGIYISRTSPTTLRNAIHQYEQILPQNRPRYRDQIGDMEVCLYFQTTNPQHIPLWFKKSENRIRAGKKHGYRKET